MGKELWERKKGWLGFALVCVFLWGMAGHGYAFFDNSFSHDSLNEFHSGILGNNIKMQSGRVFTSLYRDLLRSDITLPWLIGVLALVWLGLALFFTMEGFRVKSKAVWLVSAGIMTVNIAVSATAATYLHDLDCYMFSVMLGAAAFWLWREFSWGWLPGAVLICGVMGIYQSYTFVAVGLVMMASILDLAEGRSFREVFFPGLKAIAMVVIGGGLYYIAMKVRLHFAGLKLYDNNYNSLYVLLRLDPKAIPELIGRACRDWFQRLWDGYNAYPSAITKGITLVLVLAGGLALLPGLKKTGWPERLLCLTLLALLPLGTHMIYVMTNGYIHELMAYPAYLSLLLPVLLSQRLSWKWSSVFRGICLALAGMLIWGNVQFANGMYLKKDMEYDAYLSLMTRVVARMEMEEDYVPGQTPVVFLGLPKSTGVLNDVTPGFDEFWEVAGMQTTDVIYMPEQSRYQAYFDYVLGVPLLLAQEDVWNQIQASQAAQEMPCYPDADCLQMLDGVLVVKLGES